jgi:hypothetical protein
MLCFLIAKCCKYENCWYIRCFLMLVLTGDGRKMQVCCNTLHRNRAKLTSSLTWMCHKLTKPVLASKWQGSKAVKVHAVAYVASMVTNSLFYCSDKGWLVQAGAKLDTILDTSVHVFNRLKHLLGSVKVTVKKI